GAVGERRRGAAGGLRARAGLRLRGRRRGRAPPHERDGGHRVGRRRGRVRRGARARAPFGVDAVRRRRRSRRRSRAHARHTAGVVADVL
ncbi:MAG: hypothetical protein AVDCRST_MAG40-433, partial [uncultured Gemmatimonadaceae bacterium]